MITEHVKESINPIPLPSSALKQPKYSIYRVVQSIFRSIWWSGLLGWDRVVVPAPYRHPIIIHRPRMTATALRFVPPPTLNPPSAVHHIGSRRFRSSGRSTSTRLRIITTVFTRNTKRIPALHVHLTLTTWSESFFILLISYLLLIFYYFNNNNNVIVFCTK